VNAEFEAPDQQGINWWLAHLTTKPIVVIECGQCRKPIGEIKRDGNITMALRKMTHPEPTVPDPTTNWSASSVAQLDDWRTERAQHVLKRFDDCGVPREVMKQRRDLRGALGPIELFSSYCCPTHGEIPIDKAHLARFVAGSTDTRKKTRQYPIPYEMP